jgi:hypothetical protein
MPTVVDLTYVRLRKRKRRFGVSAGTLPKLAAISKPEGKGGPATAIGGKL